MIGDVVLDWIPCTAMLNHYYFSLYLYKTLYFDALITFIH